MTITTGTLRVGILAIVAGLIGAYVIQQVLTSRPEPVVAGPRLIEVPMAASPLPEGRVVTLGDVVLVSMREDELRKAEVPVQTIMMDPSQIVGRRLRQPLGQGELFTTVGMFLEFAGPNLSEKLKPGYRAFSLSMNSQQGSRFYPGTMVDVLFRSQPRGAKDGQLAIPEMTVTLLQSLEVIHVELPPPTVPGANRPSGNLDLARRSAVNVPPPTIVTMAVTPKDAKVLQTAMGHGEITLSPWSAQDRIASPESPKDGLTLEEILGIEPPAPVAPAVITPPFVTEVYRRGSADIRGYSRDAIFRYDPRKPAKPGDLPRPNAIPAPNDN